MTSPARITIVGTHCAANPAVCALRWHDMTAAFDTISRRITGTR